MIINLSLESICDGGGHATIGIIVNGGAKRLVSIDVDTIRGPIDNIETLTSDIIKLSISGLTRLQARNKLLAGVTVTL